jgi:hypothetical protein
MSLGLAAAVGAGCGPDDQALPPGAVPPVAVVTGLDLAVQRLDRVAEATEPAMARRNPFMFGPRQAADNARTAAQPPLPPPDGLPMLPLPLATPPLRLLGLVTLTDGARVAVLTVGSDLVMARAGEVIARRFRVVEIGEQTVALTDAVGERPVRLSLP